MEFKGGEILFVLMAGVILGYGLTVLFLPGVVTRDLQKEAIANGVATFKSYPDGIKFEWIKPK